jgi:hypothetical protein
MKANVLSFAEVENMYDILYVPREGFIVHLPDRDTHFHCREKLHVADWNDAYVNTTVKENESVYTKAEVGRAHTAYELLHTSGYPSLEEAIHLVHGNIQNIPNITCADIKRAYHIV